MFQNAIVSVGLVTLLVIANRHFGWSHRFQEWRYGRKIDETVDWQAFNKAFKADK